MLICPLKIIIENRQCYKRYIWSVQCSNIIWCWFGEHLLNKFIIHQQSKYVLYMMPFSRIFWHIFIISIWACQHCCNKTSIWIVIYWRSLSESAAVGARALRWVTVNVLLQQDWGTSNLKLTSPRCLTL